MQPTSLSDDSPVARGGISRDPTSLLQQLQDNIDDGDGPVLSVFIVEPNAERSAEQALVQACHDGPVMHGQVQVSSLGRLRSAGFLVVQEGNEGESYCHHHVYFEEPVTYSRAREWIECFDLPIPNPDPDRRRRR